MRAKMEQKEYIILCLEDSNDWSNATTRRLVMLVRRQAFCIVYYGDCTPAPARPRRLPHTLYGTACTLNLIIDPRNPPDVGCF